MTVPLAVQQLDWTTAIQWAKALSKELMIFKLAKSVNGPSISWRKNSNWFRNTTPKSRTTILFTRLAVTWSSITHQKSFTKFETTKNSSKRKVTSGIFILTIERSFYASIWKPTSPRLFTRHRRILEAFKFGRMVWFSLSIKQISSTLLSPQNLEYTKRFQKSKQILCRTTKYSYQISMKIISIFELCTAFTSRMRRMNCQRILMTEMTSMKIERFTENL